MTLPKRALSVAGFVVVALVSVKLAQRLGFDLTFTEGRVARTVPFHLIALWFSIGIACVWLAFEAVLSAVVIAKRRFMSRER
jgi:hypothetical protein